MLALFEDLISIEAMQASDMRHGHTGFHSLLHSSKTTSYFKRGDVFDDLWGQSSHWLNYSVAGRRMSDFTYDS